ncbi:hypothetical protein Tco_1408477 [Tanacetum coccineum]
MGSDPDVSKTISDGNTIFRKTLADGQNEGVLHLGRLNASCLFDLSPEDKDRYNADIRATNILLQGLPKDIYSLINHYMMQKDNGQCEDDPWTGSDSEFTKRRP